MSEEEKKLNNQESADAGSSGDLIAGSVPSANKIDGGEAISNSKEDIDLSKYVSKEDYEELEKKLGSQGTELGDMRNFFGGISPLLEKLDQDPELVEAIMDGKVDSKTLEAISKGETSVEDVTKVTKAHEAVKKDLGREAYKAMSPEDIEKLVTSKVQEAVADTKKSFEKGLSSIEDNREFEGSVTEFIKNTPDFPDYAGDITEWFEEHPEQFDIEIAYNAVKGKSVVKVERENAEKRAAEEAKNIALNASTGGSQGSQIVKDQEVIDSLIATSPNPNSF